MPGPLDPLVEENALVIEGLTAFDEIKRRKAAAALRHDLKKKEVVQKVLEELQSLPDTVHLVKAQFRRIRGELADFDAAGYTNENGCPIHLSTPWAEYTNMFDKLLEESQRNAAEAAASIEVFRGIFPEKLTLSSFASFKARIESFIETIRDKDKVAYDLEKKFAQLAENLYDFVKVIEKAMESTVQKQIGLHEQLAHLCCRKNEIVQCIKSIHLQIRATGKATLMAFATGAVSVGVLILTLTPVTIGQVIINTLEVIDNGVKLRREWKQIDQLKQDLSDVEKSIHELSERHEEVKKHQETLENTKGDVETLATKMEAIAGIWQALEMDMVKLHFKLGFLSKLNSSNEETVDDVLWEQLENTRSLYELLHEMLEAYAKNILLRPYICTTDTTSERASTFSFEVVTPKTLTPVSTGGASESGKKTGRWPKSIAKLKLLSRSSGLLRKKHNKPEPVALAPQ